MSEPMDFDDLGRKLNLLRTSTSAAEPFVANHISVCDALLARVHTLEHQVRGYQAEVAEADQLLGKALHYPTEGPEIGGDGTTVCTGEHTLTSLAAEAAWRIAALEAELGNHSFTAAVRADFAKQGHAARVRTLEGDNDGLRKAYALAKLAEEALCERDDEAKQRVEQSHKEDLCRARAAGLREGMRMADAVAKRLREQADAAEKGA